MAPELPTVQPVVVLTKWTPFKATLVLNEARQVLPLSVDLCTNPPEPHTKPVEAFTKNAPVRLPEIPNPAVLAGGDQVVPLVNVTRNVALLPLIQPVDLLMKKTLLKSSAVPVPLGAPLAQVLPPSK